MLYRFGRQGVTTVYGYRCHVTGVTVTYGTTVRYDGYDGRRTTYDVRIDVTTTVCRRHGDRRRRRRRRRQVTVMTVRRASRTASYAYVRRTTTMYVPGVRTTVVPYGRCRTYVMSQVSVCRRTSYGVVMLVTGVPSSTYVRRRTGGRTYVVPSGGRTYRRTGSYGRTGVGYRTGYGGLRHYDYGLRIGCRTGMSHVGRTGMYVRRTAVVVQVTYAYVRSRVLRVLTCTTYDDVRRTGVVRVRTDVV